MPTKAAALRGAFASQPFLRIVGAHDALGAKLIERNGFQGVWASGLEISASHAVPDANILTMTDFLAAAVSMNEATNLPVICDCDTGFGSAANVSHMVRRYEAAGVAAVVIEDKVFPKVNSFVAGRQELADIAEFTGKIEAAKSTQRSPDFMVLARVEALIAGWGLEEALRRATAYAEAGADGIVIHSKATSPDEVYAFAREWKRRGLPLVVIPTMFFSVTAQELQDRGFKMAIYANHGLRASIRAMDETFRAIRETGSTAAVEDRIASMREVFDLQGMNRIRESEERFGRRDGVTAVIPAAGDDRLRPGFEAILGEKPLCMVDIGGKTLLDRQVETLSSLGVTDIHVVGGFRGDRIRADGVRVVDNPDFERAGTAHSVLCAAGHFGSKCLVVYGDILFDRRVVELLLKSPYPATIVLDRAYRTLPFRDKRIDLAVAEDLGGPSNGARRLDWNAFKRVRWVGRAADKTGANTEFIGMALFQEEGVRALTDAWREAGKRFAGSPFYEAPDVARADFNDLLQFVIDRGFPLHGLEVEHGWSEIHSPEDLERARAHFARERAGSAPR